MAAIVIEIGVSAKDPCAHSIYNLSLSLGVLNYTACSVSVKYSTKGD